MVTKVSQVTWIYWQGKDFTFETFWKTPEREVKEAGRLVRRRGIPYWIMVILSRSLDISKNELARYITSFLNSTFRLWLAEVRLCSFSARTYLYRIFKLKEGCTPAEWREKMAENVAAEGKKQD